ncbi:CDP-alcohol phosphatidyltransferase family protein [Pendulispora brunnea]|uniref:CDP-alcohol phosphatidyltransferase family protein n=1 Tax=Pendulispora brunnea TaxID=2905690 RepID=A0ABZ2K9B9_9BACT
MLCITLVAVLAAFFALTLRVGVRTFERLEREAPLAIVGKAPMEAVYSALQPVARLIVWLGISANGVTLSSLGFAALAAMFFALGHFGLGAFAACAAALADAVDGLVARQTQSVSRFGKLLDTTVDRYVEALFLGGIAIYVHDTAWMLALVLAALVGGFMVSYASAMLREIGAPDPKSPMRRAERLTFLLAGAVLVPLVASAAPDVAPAIQLLPLLVGLGAIAVVGNVSAARRMLAGARWSDETTSYEKSWPTSSRFLIQRESVSVGGTDERRRSPRARCDADSV